MDTFEEVYNLPSVFEKYLPEDCKHPCWNLRKGIYYQTQGGGPEGGYVVMPSGEVYAVERDWFAPFEFRLCEGKRLVYEDATDEYVRNVTLVDI